MIKWLELEAFTIEEMATPLFFQQVMMNKRFSTFLLYCRTSWTAERRFNFSSFRLSLIISSLIKDQIRKSNDKNLNAAALNGKWKKNTEKRICTILVVQTSNLRDPSPKESSCQDNDFVFYLATASQHFPHSTK